MKKIYFSILVISMLGLGSCTKDFIELTPTVDQLESNFYKTEADASVGLAAVYNALVVQPFSFVPVHSDILSDDAFTGGGDPSDVIQFQQQEKFLADGENAEVKVLWQRCYKGVFRANIMLQKLDGIAWTSDANKKRVAAELKFLRAYFYWDLVRHYGWAPFFTEPLTPESAASMKQSSPSELYTQIAKDLLAAVKDLPVTVPSTEIGHVTQGAVQALIARIYLYYTGFAQPVFGITTPWTDGSTVIDKAYAKAALESVITSKAYKLLDNYADVFSWTNQNNAEDVFTYQYDGASGASDWGNLFITHGNFSCTWLSVRTPVGDATAYPGYSCDVPSFSLVAAYEAGDPRYEVTIYDANTKLTSYKPGYMNTGYFNNKFRGRADFISKKGDPNFNFSLNYADIRYSDVLLMAAELNLSDNAAKAVEYFNKVRTRALGANAAKTAITMDDIFNERRVEFGGEGHRYWDLLRRGLDVAKANIDASFQNIPARANVTATDFTPRNFNKETYGMYPIPSSEMKLSGGILKQYIPAYKNIQ